MLSTEESERNSFSSNCTWSSYRNCQHPDVTCIVRSGRSQPDVRTHRLYRPYQDCIGLQVPTSRRVPRYHPLAEGIFVNRRNRQTRFVVERKPVRRRLGLFVDWYLYGKKTIGLVDFQDCCSASEVYPLVRSIQQFQLHVPEDVFRSSINCGAFRCLSSPDWLTLPNLSSLAIVNRWRGFIFNTLRSRQALRTSSSPLSSSLLVTSDISYFILNTRNIHLALDRNYKHLFL